MKAAKFILATLILMTLLDASPRGHRRHGHFRAYGPRVVMVGASFHAGYQYYDPFWRPVYWPGGSYYHSGEYVLTNAEAIITQIEQLSALQKQGILSEKEFKRAKGRLLDRLGQYIPAEKNTENTSEILKQLQQLHESQSAGILDESDFARQKKKLLRLI